MVRGISPAAADASACFGGRLATGVRDVTHDLTALDSRGWWAVLLTFEGEAVCARFDSVVPTRPATSRLAPPAPEWPGIPVEAWVSSLTQREYVEGVQRIRAGVAAGDYYQVNLCRVLSAPLPDGADLRGLAAVLQRGNPAPYAGWLLLPDQRPAPVDVVCASPELFLRRDGEVVESGPIKGTAATVAGLSAKDRAENVMIVDLVRNDLGRVAVTGSVEVPALNAVEPHPGLVHLVSIVRAMLRPGLGWAELIEATFPPGSVTGAPKSSALAAIGELEPTPRGPYCGGLGWVDADRARGTLAVGIRTFWAAEGRVHFGTGAGITWGSDPQAEWAETELKAARLLDVAAQATPAAQERTTP